jgi:hypothetical protein
MTRYGALMAAGLACTACAADHDASAEQATAALASATGNCIAGGGGFLRARLRGALEAELDWSNADMQCAGGPRPDGKGVRLTFAGQLPGAAGAPPRQVRFIFGMDLDDVAAGPAQAMPTNLTVIVEGEGELYATRGSRYCAVESLERVPLDATHGRQLRVHARGYCVGPATDLADNARLLVPTFEFTGVADAEVSP